MPVDTADRTVPTASQLEELLSAYGNPEGEPVAPVVLRPVQQPECPKRKQRRVKARRRHEVARTVVWRVRSVLVAVLVGIVAGALLYALANVGLLRLVDERAASEPVPAAPAP